MARYSKKEQVSEETKTEALQVARATQKPGQTKAQTKLIAQGIQKGIEHYKKQQKSKARELDKKIKKANANLRAESAETEIIISPQVEKKPVNLSLILLVLSWIFFAGYLFLNR